MDDRTITVSISESEQAFIDSEIASGRYASGSEVMRAGLAALEHVEAIRDSRMDDIDDDARQPSGEPGSLAYYLSANAQHLKLILRASEASGKSTRDVPQIMSAVKSKLRANGSL
jgi:putative addiction module CopG family antidote